MTMRFSLLVSAAVLGAAVSANAADVPDPTDHGHAPPSLPAEQWGLIDEYCASCHNFEDWAGGIAFDVMSPDDLHADAEVWEETVTKLRGAQMPPAGEPHPGRDVVNRLIASLETTLDAGAELEPDPGRVPIHRLNRIEYARVIKDLLALDVDPAALLPQDTESEGFTNIASALALSPTFLDQYIAAARDIAIRAVGEPAPKPTRAVFAAAGDQSMHVEGLPLGTRGGLLAHHVFPADGTYEFDILGLATAGYVSGLDDPHTLVMTIDGEPVFTASLGGEEDLRAVDQELEPALAAIEQRFQDVMLPVTAGPHDVGVAFIARSFARSDARLAPIGALGAERRIPNVGQLVVSGPFEATGVGDTPSREKIFICRPDTIADEDDCAREILANLTRRAYRRPVTDEDLRDPMRFYAAATIDEGFEGGVRAGLTAILASPHFLFRTVQAPEGAVPGESYPISDLELASRLSFFLWSQGPDEELLGLAEQGVLRELGVLDGQVERMLADVRADALVSNFALRWLRVDRVGEVDPDPDIFPEYDRGLLADFKTEMELFVASVFEEDRPVTELMTADHTFLNERLARHYDVPGVRGDQFRRVTLESSERRGLLGKGILLMGTSYGNRTSPVVRGSYLLENILGTPPALPTISVPALEDAAVAADVPPTVREMLRVHREDPACHACHAVMDPLGIALENFDAIGRWRVIDQATGAAIDASGELADGSPVAGVDDLRDAIMTRPDQFPQTVARKLTTYAVGRAMEAEDMPAVRAIVREAADDDYRFSALVAAIVKSDLFQMSTAPELAALEIDEAHLETP